MEQFKSIKDELIYYCHDCINSPERNGVKHIWACERFLNDLTRSEQEDDNGFPFVWNEAEAQRIVKWFSLLKHSKGTIHSTHYMAKVFVMSALWMET